MSKIDMLQACTAVYKPNYPGYQRITLLYCWYTVCLSSPISDLTTHFKSYSVNLKGKFKKLSFTTAGCIFKVIFEILQMSAVCARNEIMNPIFPLTVPHYSTPLLNCMYIRSVAQAMAVVRNTAFKLCAWKTFDLCRQIDDTYRIKKNTFQDTNHCCTTDFDFSPAAEPKGPNCGVPPADCRKSCHI